MGNVIIIIFNLIFGENGTPSGPIYLTGPMHNCNFLKPPSPQFQFFSTVVLKSNPSPDSTSTYRAGAPSPPAVRDPSRPHTRRPSATPASEPAHPPAVRDRSRSRGGGASREHRHAPPPASSPAVRPRQGPLSTVSPHPLRPSATAPAAEEVGPPGSRGVLPRLPSSASSSTSRPPHQAAPSLAALPRRQPHHPDVHPWCS
jgi:hypothetical protein